MTEPRTGRILVVEDDPALRSLIEDELAEDGLGVRSVASAEEAMELMAESPAELVVSDIRLPGEDGFALLRRTRELPHPPAVLLVTAFGSIEQAVAALKEGADDFVTKPIDLEHLRVRVGRILENRRLRVEVRRYREALGEDDFHGMIGRSEVMRTLFRDLARVARGRGPVLLQGESGVGKELAARAIHAESSRGQGPFLAVNCAGVPESLLESEFFGHVRGAFSGATGARPGLFQEASGGTLLLDEIGEMPPNLQATLLRVLQEGVIRPVGSDRTREVDVRVIAATNRDLEATLESGGFRADLFFRLETFRVEIPPLRTREGDLDLLTGSFVRRHAARLDREPPVPSRDFMEKLRGHTFPGNVRELENIVERAVTFCDEGALEPRHLPPRLLARGPGDAKSSHEVPAAGGRRRDVCVEEDPLPDLLEGRGLPTLEELELRYVRLVLEHAGGNKRRAAALLGISRRTLYRKLALGGEEADGKGVSGNGQDRSDGAGRGRPD